ncbi:MAG: hypothetical protein PHY48_04600 [Candidatus Cloacimonetes bacterium]|nr:hypothetical protein [Candidatus Cloacimonadota bacterium]
MAVVTYSWAANLWAANLWAANLWADNLRIGRDSGAVFKASSGCCGKKEFDTPYLGLPISGLPFSGLPISGLTISELAETAELSLKHPPDAVAKRSLPPHDVIHSKALFLPHTEIP